MNKLSLHGSAVCKCMPTAPPTGHKIDCHRPGLTFLKVCVCTHKHTHTHSRGKISTEVLILSIHSKSSNKMFLPSMLAKLAKGIYVIWKFHLYLGYRISFLPQQRENTVCTTMYFLETICGRQKNVPTPSKKKSQCLNSWNL